MSLSTSIGATAAIAIILTPCAFAAHPLVTEDTATQGVGNVEIENGLGLARQPGSTFIYQPQISYGASPVLDVIVQPAYLVSSNNGDDVHGVSDTNLDFKWRFFGRAPWSLAVRAGLAAATSQHHLGIAHGSVSKHALLVLTYDEAPLTVHVNAGYVRNPDLVGTRQDLKHASSAVLWTINEKLIVSAEAAIDSSADPTTAAWGGSALAGIIYTLRPGLDLDLGFQTGIDSSIAARTWLGGITYRFAL